MFWRVKFADLLFTLWSFSYFLDLDFEFEKFLVAFDVIWENELL